MKTITICREDARRLGLPAGAKVQIQLRKDKCCGKAHDVYYKGKHYGLLHLDHPEGVGR